MPVHAVPTFGGGINVAVNPLAIADDEWTWSNGVWPNRGTAEFLPPYLDFGETIPPANYDPLGVITDSLAPYLSPTPVKNAVLIPHGRDGDSDDVIVRRANLLGGVVVAESIATISPTGTSPSHESSAGGDVKNAGVSGMAVLNGVGYFALGLSGSSLCSYTGSVLARVEDGSTVRGRFLATAEAHLLLAVGSTDRRTVRVSAVNDGTDWTATVANDADSVTLDSIYPISGLTTMPGGAVVSCEGDVYLFRATGSIPPFTVQSIPGRGSLTQPVSTPVGVFLNAQDGVYQVGGGRVNDRMGTYVQSHYDMLWHPEYSAIVFAANTGAATEEAVYLDPQTGRWWRALLPSTVVYNPCLSGQHTVARIVLNSATGRETVRYVHTVLSDNDTMHYESSAAGAVYSGAYVDTKDFAFGSPPQLVRHKLLKVDWEPLSNATTDAITVWAAARDHLSQSVLGSDTMEMDGMTFTQVGTLTGGDSELPIDVMGKYVRYRFKQSSGKARIRGFHIHWDPAGVRKTP